MSITEKGEQAQPAEGVPAAPQTTTDTRATTSTSEFPALERGPDTSRSSGAQSAISRVSDDTVRRRMHRLQSVHHKYRPPGAARNWHPGTEPGLDPHIPADGIEAATLIEPSQLQHSEITVVDFSRDDMQMYNLDNQNLGAFLAVPRSPKVACRWINVNGLSWDVVSLLARHKNIHRLAVEDLIASDSRTKVNWFSDHTHVQLKMQKLIKLGLDDEDDSDIEENADANYNEDNHSDYQNHKQRSVIVTALSRLLRCRSRSSKKDDACSHSSRASTHSSHSGSSRSSNSSRSSSSSRMHYSTDFKNTRTIQRFRGAPNEDRIAFMERNAALLPKDLGVVIEQVSIFLHADNTITSFFEESADEIETPIVQRLSSPETILRKSCDASMVMQAIIDAVVDLAIPVTMAYEDVMGELELKSLTDPDLAQSSNLYILTSELSVLRNAIQPTIGVVKQLRYHQSDPTISKQAGGGNNDGGELDGPVDAAERNSAVRISSTTHTYLGDVWDHCKTITESYDQMSHSADSMITLIYNTITAQQMENTRQMTMATVFFLPLTFLTVCDAAPFSLSQERGLIVRATDVSQGYFGMNFDDFPGIKNSDGYVHTTNDLSVKKLDEKWSNASLADTSGRSPFRSSSWSRFC
ncbi:hypothetical protein KEM55_003618 [Ascosphaera atra]|nr:hypothetical protein KEM55_003618 [Ascosphaera atra]